MIQLPKTDKNGKPRLSYSQIKCFKENKQEWKRRYMLNQEFEGNAYTDFGTKVGEALEYNSYTDFNEGEQDVLTKCTRLDEFERRITLNFDEFVLYGYIDTNSADLTKIIDYKTGGYGKEVKYIEPDYTQLQLYALGIKQETGIDVKSATVEFITRGGQGWKGEEMYVADQPIIEIEMDISKERLDFVFYQTIEDAKKISEFYLKNI